MAEAPRTNSNARRIIKSAAAYRTIGEVSMELDLPQHVLRFWEAKFPLVKPLKRGGGRRYYRPEDVDLLRRIRDLLYTDGYTIKGVQKLLRQNDAKMVPTDGPGYKLGPRQRAALEAVIGELEQLREMLRGG